MKTVKIFTATWCQPCKQYKQTLSNIKTDVNVVTVDVDAWKEEAMEAGVRSVPTTILYENDVEIRRKSGVMTSDQFDWFVNQKETGFA